MVSGNGPRGRPRPAAGPARLRSRPARLAAFAALTASFAATLGFLGGAAPIVLRERGAPLAAIGLLQLIYLPLGLTFAWAPVLDRLRLPALPHRLGWIAAMQALGILLLLALMAAEGWPAGALFALALAVSVAFATMDVSLEALVVETVGAAGRPAVTTAKLCGGAVGGLIGGGLLLVVSADLGWRGSFAVLAAFDALCLMPMLFYPEDSLRRLGGSLARAARHAAEAAPPRRGLPRALLGHALLLGLYFGASTTVASAYGLFLQDLGLPLAEIGVLAGTLGPAVNLAAILLSGALMAAVAAERLVAVLTVGVAASGALLGLAALLSSPRLAVAGVVLGSVAASGLGVPVFNALYRWAQGTSAATDYAVLFGIGFLVAMPARVAGPALAGALGWPAFFALATPLHFGSLALVALAMHRTRRHDEEARLAAAA